MNIADAYTATPDGYGGVRLVPKSPFIQTMDAAPVLKRARRPMVAAIQTRDILEGNPPVRRISRGMVSTPTDGEFHRDPPPDDRVRDLISQVTFKVDTPVAAISGPEVKSLGVTPGDLRLMMADAPAIFPTPKAAALSLSKMTDEIRAAYVDDLRRRAADQKAQSDHQANLAVVRDYRAGLETYSAEKAAQDAKEPFSGPDGEQRRRDAEGGILRGSDSRTADRSTKPVKATGNPVRDYKANLEAFSR